MNTTSEQEKRKFLMLTFKAPIFQKLQKAADSEGLPVSSYARWCIIQKLKSEEAQ